ncbi:MAG TPA: hypothetical protein VN025_02950 [Candidatus Dormibacteraeota bacterium]|jgi:hypothetical protein|nr:hypothetical protein [Candidatus Dormibacteraeota bacterium]
MFTRNRRILLLALACGLASFPASAQDADKVLDAAIKASGGSGKLRKVLTLSVEGTVTRQSDSKTGAYTLNLKSPNRYYAELTFAGQPEILAYNAKSAWRENSTGEIGTLLGPEALELEAAAQLYNSHLLDRKKNKTAAIVAGTSQISGHDAVEVQLTTQSGVKRSLFFDAQTHLLLKDSGNLGGQLQETAYGDYQPESGIQVAHKLEIHRGSEIYQVTVTRVAVNQTIGERMFDFPKKSQVQLPDLKKLFEEIDANQKAIDKIRENYSGRRSEEETEMDKNGKITKHEVHDFTFFYLNGEEVSTLVAKDNKPLSQKEQDKENEHTKKRIEEIQKEQAKKEAKEEKKKEEGAKGKDKDDDPGIEIFLHVCQFVNPRHERFRGQDVLVFDFEPNPEYKAHSLVEGIVQKLAGVVWVDEKAHQVVRIEGYFVGDAKIAGGLLVNLQKGSSFIDEQAFLNNEVWLPTYEEAHIGARFLLVKGIKVNEVTRYSDYKRFNVETLNTISKPKDVDTPANPQ